MTSQVFYRKWRPRSFAELVGQEPVAATLRQAVAQGRIAHAYLFCGPRGTGKTSTARILAKALNCLKPQGGEPCNACDVCVAFNQDRFLDLVEVDAASNRRIDEMRELRERVRFSPSVGRYKVYIIDEAHMLTKEASNAFLKTLEEPPAHVVFVLCTTEPQDLLPTIISRCQRYDFRRLASQAVVSRLQHICREERIEAEPEALPALARAASGSLRDAENLLEQLAVSHGRVALADVREALGLSGGEEALELVRRVLKGDTAGALTTINRAIWAGVDARHLHRQAVELLRGVLVHSYGVGETLDVTAETSQALAALAKVAPTPRVVYVLRKLGEADLRHDSPSALGLELAVVEACAYPDTVGTPAQPASEPSPGPVAQQAPVRGVGAPVPPRRPVPQGAPPARSAPPVAAPAGASRPQPPRPAAAAPASGPSSATDGPWKQLVNALRQCRHRRFGIDGLFNSTRSHRIEGDTLVLEFVHRSHMERLQGELEDPPCRNAVEQTIIKVLGGKHELKLVLVEENGGSRATTAQSPMVRAALNLGARIVAEKEADEQAATAPGTATPGAHGPDGGGAGGPDR